MKTELTSEQQNLFEQVKQWIQSTSMEEWEREALAQGVERSVREGWLFAEIICELIFTEHVTPSLPEETALLLMSELRARVKERLRQGAPTADTNPKCRHGISRFVHCIRCAASDGGGRH